MFTAVATLHHPPAPFTAIHEHVEKLCLGPITRIDRSEYPVFLRMYINWLPAYGPGEAELTIPDAAYGEYSFNLQARVGELGDPYAGTAVTFDIYVGDVLERHDAGRITGDGYTIFGLWFPPNFVYEVPPVVRIKIQLASSTLAPLGDNDNKNNPNKAETTRPKVIDFSKVKPTTVTVTVKYSDGQPVPDYPFTLSAYVRDNSGGHDHTANRPTGRFIKSKDTVTTFSDKTGSDGTVAYRYLYGGFGGVDSLRVKGKTEEDTSTKTILLRIPNLEELKEGDHYVLVGQFGTGSVTSQHRVNHYGTSNLIQTLKALADSIYADTSSILRFNDISLLFGGPFDIQNDWNTPHQTHRNGSTADVDDVDSIQRTISVNYLKKWLNLIDPKAKILDEINHFHVTVR